MKHCRIRNQKVTTNYDPIAERYGRAKLHSWRQFIESHTLSKLIGDPGGLDVLDLACGEGFYTRKLKAMGTSRTVGADLSQRMIDLARAREAEERLDIEFLTADALALPDLGHFDLVTAAYLLNYARNGDELKVMLSGIARCLWPGGRFVTANSSPFFDYASAPDFSKYGFRTGSSEPTSEGSKITWTFLLDDGPIEVENYWLSPETHENALNDCGFRDIRWHTPELSPAGAAESGVEFWRTFLEAQPVTFLECRYMPT